MFLHVTLLCNQSHMFLLDLLDDFILGPINLIDRIEGCIKGMYYRDRGHKIGVKRYDKGGKYALREIEQLLNKYGVVIYGRTYDSQHRFFFVKRRQAVWAEYLLLHAGVEITTPLVNTRNLEYVANHPSDWMPTPWCKESND